MHTAKIRNRRWAFSYIFHLWLFRAGVTDCKWRTKPTKCCKVSGLVKQATAIKNHGKCTEIWERWVVNTIALPTSAPRKRSRWYWETRSNVKGEATRCADWNNQTKIFGRKKKTHLLLRILAVISRFGPYLTVVMIFVTQNNFKNGPVIPDCLWILPNYRTTQLLSQLRCGTETQKTMSVAPQLGNNSSKRSLTL